jgi:hypothetical protein
MAYLDIKGPWNAPASANVFKSTAKSPIAVAGLCLKSCAVEMIPKGMFSSVKSLFSVATNDICESFQGTRSGEVDFYGSDENFIWISEELRIFEEINQEAHHHQKMTRQVLVGVS